MTLWECAPKQRDGLGYVLHTRPLRCACGPVPVPPLEVDEYFEAYFEWSCRVCGRSGAQILEAVCVSLRKVRPPRRRPAPLPPPPSKPDNWTPHSVLKGRAAKSWALGRD